MENSNITKIKTAGKIGYVISILLIVCTIIAMIAIGICTAACIVVADDDINVKMSTNINVNSTGNFLKKLGSFVKIDGVDDLNKLTEEAKDGIEINDKDISELSVKEENGGLIIDLKTNEITISMKRIIAALIAAFIFLGSVTVSLYMVKALMKSLKDSETPFSEEVVKNMTRFATSLICVIAIKTIMDGFWGALLKPGFHYNLSIDLGSVLLVAVIYILITVFKYGAKLQQESDETV